MKQPVRESVPRHGRATAANGADMIGSGMFRVMVASGAGLILLETGSGSALSFSAVVLALIVGVLLMVGRPVFLMSYFVTLLIDSALVGVLAVGSGEVFLSLFYLAALPLIWIPDVSRAVFAGCFAFGAYAVSSLATVATLEAGDFLSLGGFGLFCAAICVMAAKNGEMRADGLRTRVALEAERGYSGSVSDLALNFGPVLEVLNLERILQWTAGTARDLTSAEFAHVVVLDGNRHATSASEDLEVLPTWWHPVLQESVLRGSRRKGPMRGPEKQAADVRGLLCVPLRIEGSEHNGTLVVGGRSFEEKDERVLTLIADQASSALANAWESPGGRDFATGLPNRDSFYRVLDETLSQGAAVTVVCLRFEGIWDDHRINYESERLLRMAAEEINASQRTYRYKSEELFVILRSGGERRAERFCRWAEGLVEEVSSGSASRFEVTTGYVIADPKEYDATSAVGRARRLARGQEVSAGRSFPDVPEAADTTVAALLEAASIRDSGLAEHMKSVRNLSRMIGSEMGLEKRDMETLSLGAMLHDIGKIGVPDGVLKKPGKLTNEEFDLIKHHTVMGAGVVSQIPHLSEIVPIVRHHHERQDGRGYPDGLAGKNIPLHARIVFVADAYDSMVQDRPYRKGLSHEEAVEEIRRNAGTQFDPEIAGVFLKLAPGLRSERFRRTSGEIF